MRAIISNRVSAERRENVRMNGFIFVLEMVSEPIYLQYGYTVDIGTTSVLLRILGVVVQNVIFKKVLIWIMSQKPLFICRLHEKRSMINTENEVKKAGK